MRDHKFRGQRVDTKEWVYGSLIWTPNAKNGFKSTIVTDDANLWWSFRTHGITPSRDLNIKGNGWFQVIPETVSEYTGRNDKKGVEIYKGDICRGKRGGSAYLYVVKWDEIDARFLGYTTNGYICCVGQEPFVEAIGNIYENPELLEEAR